VVLRFKQFVGRPPELEQMVNEWLAEFEPDVTQMVQTVNSDGSMLLAFLFEESFRGQELRLSSEHHAARPMSGVSAAHIPPERVAVAVEPGTAQVSREPMTGTS
jgi:hypothetical protein